MLPDIAYRIGLILRIPLEGTHEFETGDLRLRQIRYGDLIGRERGRFTDMDPEFLLHLPGDRLIKILAGTHLPAAAFPETGIERPVLAAFRDQYQYTGLRFPQTDTCHMYFDGFTMIFPHISPV